MCRVSRISGQNPVEKLLLKPETASSTRPWTPSVIRSSTCQGGDSDLGRASVKPERPLLYHRPAAAFYNDNVEGIIPSLQASTLLAHVRAADYNASCVLADENCHPFSYQGTPWIVAQNGDLPNWKLLQRELLRYCKDENLGQMRGSTDTEFLYVLRLSCSRATATKMSNGHSKRCCGSSSGP